MAATFAFYVRNTAGIRVISHQPVGQVQGWRVCGAVLTSITSQGSLIAVISPGSALAHCQLLPLFFVWKLNFSFNWIVKLNDEFASFHF